MRGSKYLIAAFVAVALGALAIASASAGSDRDDVRGIKVGPLGQVFGSPPSDAGEARALATSKHRPIHATGSAATAYGSAVTFDPLSMQYKDKDWKHNYQSWCDVDPSCNGWTKKMQEYEQNQQ